MRLVVCGSRNWTDRALLERVLDDLALDIEGPWGELIIREGGAEGADALGKAWAEANGYTVESYPADWETWGRAIAGKARNRDMLEDGDGADGVVAFSTRCPATTGTAHMCRIAYDAGLTVVFVTPDGAIRELRREP